jgi:spermidine synthase
MEQKRQALAKPPNNVLYAARTELALLLLTPLVAGAVVMALELIGLRLLTPRFGASTHVWGGLLGTVMAILALGYLLGGWLADRWPWPTLMHGLLLAASLYLVVVLFLDERLLDLSEGLGFVWGPVLATFLLFGPPMLLLGSVSPFVIKLLAELRWVGTRAGQVFALSTAGSLTGMLLTAFWLIPSFGTRATLRLCVATILVAAVAGLIRRSRASRALLPVGLALVIVPNTGSDSALYRGESAYNTVIVEEREGGRLLMLNERRQGFHSVRSPGRVLTGLYYDFFYLGPILSGGKEILILGMAGGTTVEGYRRLFPGARLTAVEIDPLIVRVARDYFGVTEGPDLEIHIQDARLFLAGGTSPFDVIEVDLFTGGPEIPFHVLTLEFFHLARKRLLPNGVILVHVLAPGGVGTLAGTVSVTMASVFPSVFEVPLTHSRILLGFREEVDLGGLRARLTVNTIDELRAVRRTARNWLRRAPLGPAESILTDDWAPVEHLTQEMLERHRHESVRPW